MARLEEPTRLSVRCPACHQWAQMTGPGPDLVVDDDTCYVGFRVCPDPDCSQFVICYYELDLARHPVNILTQPAARLRLDASEVPAEITACLEEAATCQAEGCYRAAAMLVRRAVEVACELQGATGKDLKERIDSLSSMGVVSGALVDGMHRIRFLGNDAAHVEAKEYSDIGDAEVGLALKVVVKLLDHLYQNQELVRQLKELGAPKAEATLASSEDPPPVFG